MSTLMVVSVGLSIDLLECDLLMNGTRKIRYVVHVESCCLMFGVIFRFVCFRCVRLTYFVHLLDLSQYRF